MQYFVFYKEAYNHFLGLLQQSNGGIKHGSKPVLRMETPISIYLSTYLPYPTIHTSHLFVYLSVYDVKLLGKLYRGRIRFSRPFIKSMVQSFLSLTKRQSCEIKTTIYWVSFSKHLFFFMIS